MSNTSPMPQDASRNGSSPTLTQRLRARMAEAGGAREDAAGTASPKGKRPRRSRGAARTPDLTEGSAAQREARSLRRVYCEMKATYRHYRRRTGQPAVPALREAVRAFKRGQSVTALVDVAVFLDERELLRW